MKHLLLLLFTTASLAQNVANQKDFSLDHINIKKIIYNNVPISSGIILLTGDEMEISTDKTITLNCANPNGLSVDGIKVNSTEEKLKSKFPRSGQYKSIWSSQYSELTNEYRYYYIVEISDDEYIQFNVEDNIIKKIEVKFRE